MKISLVLYVYPGLEKFIDDLVNSINSQSFIDFDVLIFNDNLNNAAHLFSNIQVNYKIIEVKGSINEIRFNSLKDIILYGGESILFQDADDFMATNRVEVTKSYLERYDLVVNDLSPVDVNGNVISNSYWKGYLNHEFEFDKSFLRDKNLVGLGNTSVRKKILEESQIQFSDVPMAFDWFLFYQIFDSYPVNAVFITTTSTFYRQHDNNVAGLKKIDQQRLEHVLKVKKAHYRALAAIGYSFDQECAQLETVQPDAVNYNLLNKNLPHSNLLWWEETNSFKQ